GLGQAPARPDCAARHYAPRTLGGHGPGAGSRGDLSAADALAHPSPASLARQPPRPGAQPGPHPAGLAAAGSRVPRRVAYPDDPRADSFSRRRWRAPLDVDRPDAESRQVARPGWVARDFATVLMHAPRPPVSDAAGRGASSPAPPHGYRGGTRGPVSMGVVYRCAP